MWSNTRSRSYNRSKECVISGFDIVVINTTIDGTCLNISVFQDILCDKKKQRDRTIGLQIDARGFPEKLQQNYVIMAKLDVNVVSWHCNTVSTRPNVHRFHLSRKKECIDKKELDRYVNVIVYWLHPSHFSRIMIKSLFSEINIDVR